MQSHDWDMKLHTVKSKCTKCGKEEERSYLPIVLEVSRWHKFPDPINNWKSGVLKSMCDECVSKQAVAEKKPE